ncbi:MAG TPA: PilZ domain-containing protein [bacterium]|nr:PilZ domain-containing protein [bacterium]
MAMNPEIQPSQSQKDQRRHARLDIALAVNYAIQQAGPDGVYGASEMAETLSSDISASGLRLMTVAPLDNGSILNLEITLPEEWPGAAEPIKAQGEVVWQNKISDYSYETGTVIKYMEENEKKRLMSFVFDQMSRLVGTLAPSGGSAGSVGGTTPTLLH